MSLISFNKRLKQQCPKGWRAVPFSDILIASQYGLSSATSNDGNVPILGMSCLQDGRITYEGLSLIKLTDQEFEKFKLNKNDILINRTNSIELVGKTALVEQDKDVVFASYIVRFVLDTKQADPAYIVHYFNTPSSKKRLTSLATRGVSQANINPETLKKLFLLYLPPLPQQQKIAEILQTWDKAIQLTEQLIEKKERYKKALMQKLLSGQVRFAKFNTHRWKQVYLGNLCMIRTGKRDANHGSEMGEYPFFTCSKETKKIDQYSFDTEAILIAGNGDIGHCRYYHGKFDAYQRTYVLDKFKDIEPLFCFYVLQTFFEVKIQSQAQKGAMPYIKLSSLEKFRLYLPTKDEQLIIIKLLDKLAKIEENENIKLRSFCDQKQGLMQKLLTGAIKVSAEECCDG